MNHPDLMTVTTITSRGQCSSEHKVNVISEFTYQNKATEHYSEENEPLKILVLHKASDAAPQLEPLEVLV